MAEDPLWGIVEEERRELITLLEGLTPEQWATQSLCPAWDVRGVVAHLVSVQDSGVLTKARAALVSMGNPSDVIEYLADRYADRDPAELLALLREHVGGRTAPPGMGAQAGMTDVMVHRVDIAFPLGIEVARPPEHWRPVLDLLFSRLASLGTMRGGRPDAAYVATDLDWRHGTGAEVDGSAEALATVLSGRAALADRLSGPGAAAVREWVTT